MTFDEELGLLVAYDKLIAPKLKDAKAEARQMLMESFDKDGTDRKAVVINGEKVGEVGMNYTTPKPICTKDHEKELVEMLEPLGLVEVKPAAGWESHFTKVGDMILCTDTGEEASFLMWEGRVPKNVSVRGCKPEDVRDAFGASLPEAERVLLEGAE